MIDAIVCIALEIHGLYIDAKDRQQFVLKFGLGRDILAVGP
jgi:hypothetical protein